MQVAIISETRRNPNMVENLLHFEPSVRKCSTAVLANVKNHRSATTVIQCILPTFKISKDPRGKKVIQLTLCSTFRDKVRFFTSETDLTLVTSSTRCLSRMAILGHVTPRGLQATSSGMADCRDTSRSTASTEMVPSKRYNSLSSASDFTVRSGIFTPHGAIPGTCLTPGTFHSNNRWRCLATCVDLCFFKLTLSPPDGYS